MLEGTLMDRMTCSSEEPKPIDHSEEKKRFNSRLYIGEFSGWVCLICIYSIRDISVEIKIFCFICFNRTS